MASSDLGVRMSNWKYGIPDFVPDALFTYFNILHDDPYSGPATARKEALYNEAKSKAAGLSQSMQQNTAIMQSALDFLYQAAISEQAKERRVLERYRKDLEDILPNNKELSTILHNFTPDLLEDADALRETYSKIVEYISILQTDLTSYRNRLDSFKDHNQKDMENLNHDDYRMRIKGELHAISNSVVGAATKAQQDSDEVYASLLRTAVGEYMVKHDVVSRIKSGADLVALASAIALDIENYMDNELRKLKGTADLREYSLEEMRTIVKERLIAFSDREDRELTNLERALEEDGEQLQDILVAMKSSLGITTNASDRLVNSRHNNYKKQQNKQDSIINRLVDAGLDPKIKEELFHVKFVSTASNTLHGNIFEALRAVLQENALKVQGSAAVDILELGKISIQVQSELDMDALMNHVRKISDDFTEYTVTTRKGRFDSATQRYEEMNRAIRDTTDKITDTLHKLDAKGVKTEDIFIYHESLKLYKSIEAKNTGSVKFHGRDLEILTYIDELYSLSGLDGLKLPQRETLQFLALNIANLAVGSAQKNILAQYFGIFAGLLMFGDAYNIAEEAVMKINESQSGSAAYNIHLYDLNGFFVPASMILSFTYRAMKDANKKLQNDFGAKVEISTSGATKVIQRWIDKRKDAREAGIPYYSAGEWGRVGEEVANNTKVRIAFFSAFAEFINSLP